AFANARAVGAPDFQVKARALLAHVAARRHDPRTVALYEEAIAGARRTNQVWLLTSLHAGLAQFQATQGHTPQALDSAQQAEELRLRARLAAARAGAEPDDEGERGGDAGVAAAERDYAEFLKTVRAASGEQASLMSVEPVTLAEVQALLDEGTTLLEYLVTRGEVVVWVVDRTRSEEHT